MQSLPLPADDLDEILAATAPLWQEMRHQRLFLTGGTGFFGCWLAESFLHMNRVLALDAQITILSRSPAAFLDKVPHLRGNPALTLLEGDVRTFAFPAEPHAFIVHAATEASARQQAEQPLQMLSTLLAGTERVLTFAAAAGARKLLLTSSGAVYGLQPPNVTHMPEDFSGAPDPLLPTSVYAEGKRVSELMCALASGPGLEVKIARCYAFLGPHLPLDTHFAAGNFLADTLADRHIRIASDGAAVRSYLYAGDLAAWLWTMLFRAPSLRAYNVGSEDALNLRELAQAISPLAPQIARPLDPSTPPHRYVPSTHRARTELGLRQTVSLREGVRRTIAWHQLKSTGGLL